jgi:protein-disulfide isomerase
MRIPEETTADELIKNHSSLIEKNHDLAQSLALTATPSFIVLA